MYSCISSSSGLPFNKSKCWLLLVTHSGHRIQDGGRSAIRTTIYFVFYPNVSIVVLKVITNIKVDVKSVLIISSAHNKRGPSQI